MSKPLNVSNMKEARAMVPDLQVSGDPGAWVTICKASSNQQGWMKSTKAMEIPGLGCLVQVSTQQESLRAADGRPGYAVAEAICFVPDCRIEGGKLVQNRYAPSIVAGQIPDRPGPQPVTDALLGNEEGSVPAPVNEPIPEDSPKIIEESPIPKIFQDMDEIDKADATDGEDNNVNA